MRSIVDVDNYATLANTFYHIFYMQDVHKHALKKIKNWIWYVYINGQTLVNTIEG